MYKAGKIEVLAYAEHSAECFKVCAFFSFAENDESRGPLLANKAKRTDERGKILVPMQPAHAEDHRRARLGEPGMIHRFVALLQ